VTRLDVQIGTAIKDRDSPAPLVNMGIGETIVKRNVSEKIADNAVNLRGYVSHALTVFGEIPVRRNVQLTEDKAAIKVPVPVIMYVMREPYLTTNSALQGRIVKQDIGDHGVKINV
jgi:hypothetical protein